MRAWPASHCLSPPPAQAGQAPTLPARRPTGRRATTTHIAPDPRSTPRRPSPAPTLSLIRAGRAAAEGMSTGVPGLIVGLIWGDVEAGFEATQHLTQPLPQPPGATSSATSSATGVPTEPAHCGCRPCSWPGPAVLRAGLDCWRARPHCPSWWRISSRSRWRGRWFRGAPARCWGTAHRPRERKRSLNRAMEMPPPWAFRTWAVSARACSRRPEGRTR